MIKHYYCFNQTEKLVGKYLDVNNWDALRSGGDASFAIEASREDWENNCRRADQYRSLANRIVKIIPRDHRRWVSFGIGKGILEWNIMDIDPAITVCGTDYAPESVKILQGYFSDRSEVFCFDMLCYDDYGTLDSYNTAIMCRISTEFDKGQWKKIFDAMYETSVKEIVFVPTEILTYKAAINEMFSHLCHLISGRKDVFCGYIYSQREFEELFGRWRVAEFMNDDEPLWILSRN